MGWGGGANWPINDNTRRNDFKPEIHLSQRSAKFIPTLFHSQINLIQKRVLIPNHRGVPAAAAHPVSSGASVGFLFWRNKKRIDVTYTHSIEANSAFTICRRCVRDVHYYDCLSPPVHFVPTEISHASGRCCHGSSSERWLNELSILIRYRHWDVSMRVFR